MKRLLIAAAILFSPLAAKAATCPGYSYNLTNGQVADANQVMANFNTVLNCVTGNAAQNGINGDINQLTGLTTPLAVLEGGTGNTSGNAVSATKLFTGRTISITGDLTYTSNAFDGTGNVTGVGTLANTAVTPGTYNVAQITVDAKGRITAASAATPQVLLVRNQQPSGTGSGETLTGSSWTSRVFNTVAKNTIAGASATGANITLPAGTYRVHAEASASASPVSSLTHKLRIRDTTASATIFVGMAMAETTSGGATVMTSNADLEGIITLAGTHVLTLDSWVSLSGNGGQPASAGETEEYADVYIEKEY